MENETEFDRSEVEFDVDLSDPRCARFVIRSDRDMCEEDIVDALQYIADMLTGSSDSASQSTH
jgi:hypothetical protein